MKIRLKHLVGITLALYFLFAIFLGAAFLFQKDIANQETTNQQNISSKSLPSITLSLEEISKHSTKNDCWLIINNKVYDVTNDISTHPGGESTIVPNCGKEATSAFNTKGGQENPHTSSANELLGKDYIGDVGQKIVRNPVTIQSNSTSQREIEDETEDEIEDETDD